MIQRVVSLVTALTLFSFGENSKTSAETPKQIRDHPAFGEFVAAAAGYTKLQALYMVEKRLEPHGDVIFVERKLGTVTVLHSGKKVERPEQGEHVIAELLGRKGYEKEMMLKNPVTQENEVDQAFVGAVRTAFVELNPSMDDTRVVVYPILRSDKKPNEKIVETPK